MAKKNKNEIPEEALPEMAEETAQQPDAVQEVNPWEEKYNAEHDSYLLQCRRQ